MLSSRKRVRGEGTSGSEGIDEVRGEDQPHTPRRKKRCVAPVRQLAATSTHEPYSISRDDPSCTPQIVRQKRCTPVRRVLESTIVESSPAVAVSILCL